MPSKTHFYMIRHGQTLANAAQVMAGQMNSPLNDAGRAQAEKARAVVESLERKPELIVYSHLDRARDTAMTINRDLGISMIEDKDISEINIGAWEGTSYEASHTLFLQGINPPGGESHQEFRSRVTSCVGRHCSTAAKQPIMFVCHGGVMRAFAGAYGVTTDGFANCRLYEFEPHENSGGATLPWLVWEYDLLECGQVRRSPSPIFHEIE